MAGKTVCIVCGADVLQVMNKGGHLVPALWATSALQDGWVPMECSLPNGAARALSVGNVMIARPLRSASRARWAPAAPEEAKQRKKSAMYWFLVSGLLFWVATVAFVCGAILGADPVLVFLRGCLAGATAVTGGLFLDLANEKRHELLSENWQEKR